MKVCKEEKKMLIDWGYSEEDIEQINRLKYKFTLYNENGQIKKITQKEAKQILNSEDFLTGIARSAFHLTASRGNILIESNLF